MAFHPTICYNREVFKGDFMKEKQFIMTLGQFLKYQDYVGSGGEAKMIIDQLSIFVNGEKENRRGKKLYEGDVIEIEGDSFELILENEN